MRCIIHCPGGHKGGGALVLLLGLLIFVGVTVLGSDLEMLLNVALATVGGMCAFGIGWLVWFWRKEYISIQGPAWRGTRQLARATGASQDIPAQITAISGFQPASLENLDDTLDMPAIRSGGAQLRDEGFLDPAQMEKLMARYHEIQKTSNGNRKHSGWKQN